MCECYDPTRTNGEDALTLQIVRHGPNSGYREGVRSTWPAQVLNPLRSRSNDAHRTSPNGT